MTKIPELSGEMWIPMEPVPKERPRLGFHGAYTPVRTRTAETFIRKYVMYHHIIKEPLKCPLSVKMVFFFRRDEFSYHDNMPDIDNLAKLVLDSLGPVHMTHVGRITQKGEGLLFQNDKQVVHLEADKCWHPIPGVWIQWKTITGKPPFKHPLERDNA